MVTYCVKGFWSERVHYLSKDGETRTGKRRLSEERHLEWLRWRGRQSFTDLLFLHGVRRYGSKLVAAA
jgi:hypothetical protein